MAGAVREVLVWHWPTRVFHGSLALAFLIAYLTEGEPLWLHEAMGNLIVVLIGFRLLWGFVGPWSARFSSFVYRPARVWAYLKSIVGGRPRRFLGHNPAGGAMVLLMLVALLGTALSGLLLLAVEFGEGWLVGWTGLQAAVEAMPWFMDALKELHEWLANACLGLVLLHLAGVVAASFQHRENLPLSMLDGLKEKTSELAK